MTGLNDEPGVLAFHALLYGTPSLVARLHTHQERDEAALAEALALPTPVARPGRASGSGWPPGRSWPCAGCWPRRTGG
ncbi:hypothetical protein ACFQVA_32735 [Actinomadura keratinilytica]